MNLIRVIKKFRKILSRHQKMRIFELAVIMVIGGGMEMLSVSLILPFMETVMKPETVMENQYAKMVCFFLGIETYREFLVFLALVMAGIYVLKNLFLIIELNVQNRFVYNNMFLTQQRLLHSYLMRPYEYFINIKSGEVLRIIGSDTTNTFSLLTTLLSFFTELIVSGALIGTIFYIAPGITIAAAGLMGLLVFFIMLIIRPTLEKSGITNRNAYTGMNQWMLQAIQGIKDVKISKKEAFFERKFSENGKTYVKTTRQVQTLSILPRFLIEAASMSAFFIAIAICIYRGTGLQTIVPVLSGVAMASVRLLPSVNRISQSMATIAFHEAALDKMIMHLEDARKSDELWTEMIRGDGDGKNRVNGVKDLSLQNVVYGYPGGNCDVLSHVSLTIHRGESIGITGASGAGKTTAMDILLGLLKPDVGKVLADGVDIQLDMKGWLEQVGYIPQSIFMLDGNVRENVAFGIPEEKIDDSKVWRALRKAALDQDVRTFPDGLYTELGESGMRLSGGQRQRIGIARALYSDPAILFFDEATSALDNDTESAIMESIHSLRGQKTMIIIAHRLSTIESCDHIYRMENGKLVKER